MADDSHEMSSLIFYEKKKKKKKEKKNIKLRSAAVVISAFKVIKKVIWYFLQLISYDK